MSAVDVLAVWDAEIARYEVSAEIDDLTGSNAAASNLHHRVQPLREARAAMAELMDTVAAHKQASDQGRDGWREECAMYAALARCKGEGA